MATAIASDFINPAQIQYIENGRGRGTERECDKAVCIKAPTNTQTLFKRGNRRNENIESVGNQFAVITGPFLRGHGKLFDEFGYGNVALFPGHDSIA